MTSLELAELWKTPSHGAGYHNQVELRLIQRIRDSEPDLASTSNSNASSVLFKFSLLQTARSFHIGEFFKPHEIPIEITDQL